MKKIDGKELIGKTFGLLTVTGHERKKIGNSPPIHVYNCSCKCGNTTTVRRYNLLSHSTVSCGCYGGRTYFAKNPRWKGYQGLSGTDWYYILFKAKERNIPVAITIEDAWEQYKKQDGKCALTNLPLKINAIRSRRTERDASLDRIDSKKGYEIDNIQWVHKDIQLMKNVLNMDRFIQLCNLVVENNHSLQEEIISADQ